MSEDTISSVSQNQTSQHSTLSADASLQHSIHDERSRLERERLISLVNSMADGVIAIDQSGLVVLYNGAALNILDAHGTMTGQYLPNILRIYNSKNELIDVKKLIFDTKTQLTSRDWLLRYTDGTTINLYLSIAPVKLSYGQGTDQGYVLLLRDITREKSLEEERDEFISVISHELRTPIAITEGNISNAQLRFDKSGINDPAMKEALAQAHDQVNFLSSMINDLSNLSRAEGGMLRANKESINVYDLLTEVNNNYRPVARQKKLVFNVEVDENLEILTSSRLYVREILQNFITNAIKYTEKGSVTLGAKAANGGVLFYVQDTGIGISKSDQGKIFTKFFRSEDYRTRQHRGTGLGLYVTMKLARLIKAQITLTSELNKGTNISIYVPNLK